MKQQITTVSQLAMAPARRLHRLLLEIACAANGGEKPGPTATGVFMVGFTCFNDSINGDILNHLNGFYDKRFMVALTMKHGD